MKKMPRAVRWVLGGLVVFELAYVATGVFLVRSGRVDRWLNKHPEKRVLRFESAWTVIPGVAHVRGLRMVSQGRSNQLELVVDRAAGFINPLELLARRVHVVGLRARGVEFRFRKRPKTPDEAAARAPLVPPIEGLPFEPYGGPPKAKKTKPGWTVVFTGARVSEVRDVWMGPAHLRGAAEVGASVTVGPGDDRRISIRSANIRYYGGTFLIAGETSLRDLSLHLQGRMEPFFTKRTRGPALLDLVSARAEILATSPGAVLLNQYFAKADWLEFQSGKRKVTAEIEVERGRLRAGSHLDLAEAPLRVDLAGFIGEGQATARLEAVPSEGADTPDLRATVTYSDYGMHRLAGGPPILRGAGLTIEARSPADLGRFPPEDFDGRIALGTAEFPDLTFVNDFLPGGAGLTVERGRGKVDGRFETREGFRCKGVVTVTTTDLVVESGGVENAGDVAVTVEVRDGSLRDLRFDVGGTRVELADFAFASKGSAGDAADWRGRVAVTEGTLDLGETPGADVRLDLTFSDTRPLVAFLSRDKPLKGWAERLLTFEEITGEAVATLTKGATTIRHFGLRSGKLDVRFRALVDPRGAFGKGLARYGVFKTGIGLEGQNRDLEMIRVGSWYRNDDIPGMPPLLPEFEESGTR